MMFPFMEAIIITSTRDGHFQKERGRKEKEVEGVWGRDRYVERERKRERERERERERGREKERFMGRKIGKIL